MSEQQDPVIRPDEGSPEMEPAAASETQQDETAQDETPGETETAGESETSEETLETPPGTEELPGPDGSDDGPVVDEVAEDDQDREPDEGPVVADDDTGHVEVADGSGDDETGVVETGVVETGVVETGDVETGDDETQDADTEADDDSDTDDTDDDSGDAEAEDAEAEDAEPEITYQRYDCTVDEKAATEAAAEAARSAIERGECVVLPTDTVYGIGADAFSSEAVQALLDAKGRGRDMPPPVLIAEPKLIRALAVDVPEEAQALVDAFWPGPLTVICKAQPSLQMDLGETEGTVALRVPDHELARTLLRRTGPMAVSSANLSGRSAAITCDQAIEQLGNSVAIYLDGGPLGERDVLPSTMVDFSVEDHGVILRHGALTIEQIREFCPDVEDLHPDDELVTPAEAAELNFNTGERLDVPDTGAEMIALIEAAAHPEEPAVVDETEPAEPNEVAGSDEGAGPDEVAEPDEVTEPDKVAEPDEVAEPDSVPEPGSETESDDWPRQPPPGG